MGGWRSSLSPAAPCCHVLSSVKHNSRHKIPFLLDPCFVFKSLRCWPSESAGCFPSALPWMGVRGRALGKDPAEGAGSSVARILSLFSVQIHDSINSSKLMRFQISVIFKSSNSPYCLTAPKQYFLSVKS